MMIFEKTANPFPVSSLELFCKVLREWSLLVSLQLTAFDVD